ncbi:50S ribosomal protein L22 [Candidatus Nomurabacteria bacterium RIFCSPLOWO2_02_FULL_44_12]|uniref:Large ribosomal subunit protein uL22 n=1 Tax=Candidatus Nomurabacteria bacterium RIFCSPLOWO2_12_FULL_44_11 TaxID=1801796 RepID=A0A1F6Y6G3_9BACT|nr:MAG: 50S ribosomal protein L22 [Candidatus Nomurabacteria bacterium RIFCSPHIGHO2_12_FULL_44_22b]OGJ01936.1 MAG: 50S ribosomal protein L22 [Candidatus Nomurabacteria bacterium RIFCSPLOWO2_12_FULL_44_11]OGJ08593.1 MAG: 50S ribosomal protein L22 [Candidatus Nomurabacteria bacterium RIFCSPLOWO2_02_FULL_44_12]
MRAFLKNYRQSPRKVRLVANVIKGRSVPQAIAELDFLAKRAGLPLKKLLLSAVANAKQAGVDKENLMIKELLVNQGVTMKRMMPAAMGSGHRINKRTSNITLILAEQAKPEARKTKSEKITKLKKKV